MTTSATADSEVPTFADSTTTNILKIEDATKGLPRTYPRRLGMLPLKHMVIICDYILALRSELKLSNNYRMSILDTLMTLAASTPAAVRVEEEESKKEGFQDLTRSDIIRYLERFRKDDAADPSHK